MQAINWRNEEFTGPPAYDILGEGAVLAGVPLRLDNNIKRRGTPHNAQNMDKLLQKALYTKNFYYEGSDVPLYKGLMVLAAGFAGAVLYADGPLFLLNDNESEQIQSPAGFVLQRDCTICAPPGQRVSGAVIFQEEV